MFLEKLLGVKFHILFLTNVLRKVIRCEISHNIFYPSTISIFCRPAMYREDFYWLNDYFIFTV